MDQPHITCPRCGATSYNYHDIQFGWCGDCGAYTHVCAIGRCPNPVVAVAGNLGLCKAHATELEVTDGLVP